MKKFNKPFLFQSWFLFLFIILVGLPVHAQNFVGTYRGDFSGDWEGSFEFTIKEVNPKKLVKLEGTFKPSDGAAIIIYGFVDPKGVIEAVFYDNEKLVTSSSIRGNFKGTITPKQSNGNYDVYDVARQRVSRGDWSTQTKEPEGEILSYSILLGKDLLITDPKPIALRIHISLKEPYKDQFSVKLVGFEYGLPKMDRFATTVDPIDNFYLYTDKDGSVLYPPSGAREADFDLPYASFGTRQDLFLPKNFTVKLYVTLKCENGEMDRKEILMVPVQITSLCNVLVQKCGYGECPTLNNKKIGKLEKGSAVSGDKLLIPTDAEVCVKFLDGTLSYFVNRSQTPWLLTMRAGHFSSEQSWKNTDNTITIEGVAMKGLEAGGDKLTDKALEAGLRMLIIKGSSVSTPGVLLQISQFVGADVGGGQPVVIRLRSKLDIMFYANGTFRIRNLEGSPEVRRKQGTPLLIPVGKEVMVDRKGVVSEPVLIRTGPDEVIVKNKLEKINWQGTWKTQWGLMVIAQNGNKITGTYEHDNGKIKGTFTGNKLTGTWSEAPTYLFPNDAGEFEFTLSADGKSFTGRWRYGNKGIWQTGWDGHN
ncbi:MAG: hypothetical protein IPI68_06790 [Chitinophagaceae bacterium]|nr:hypothetical protein [Chitinophagaceae bacterium]